MGSPQHDVVTRELVLAMPMLRSWLRHLGASWDQIDEALQETAVWCCDHAEEFTPETNFAAWVRSVARFRLLALWRTQGREAARLASAALVEAIPDREWDMVPQWAEERTRALGACLKSLPQAAGRLVDQVYRHGRSAGDIAKEQGANANAIHMALTRIRQQLKSCVDRRLREI